MSRLLHSLKHRQVRLMVMTRVCAWQKLGCALAGVHVRTHNAQLHLLPVLPSRVIGCGIWGAFASQPPIPRNRSWMVCSSDRRQSELALTVGANERGLALWLCKEGAEPRLMQTRSVDFDTLRTHAGNGWAIWIVLAFRCGNSGEGT